MLKTSFPFLFMPSTFNRICGQNCPTRRSPGSTGQFPPAAAELIVSFAIRVFPPLLDHVGRRDITSAGPPTPGLPKSAPTLHPWAGDMPRIITAIISASFFIGLSPGPTN